MESERQSLKKAVQEREEFADVDDTPSLFMMFVQRALLDVPAPKGLFPKEAVLPIQDKDVFSWLAEIRSPTGL